MMLPAKSPAALAAVLAAGVTLGAFIPHAMALSGVNGISVNGISANGISANGIHMNGLNINGLGQNGRSFNDVSPDGMPFDFSAVTVQDVQFPAVGSK